MKQENLLEIINSILENRGAEKVSFIERKMDLRNDLGLNSLDLAELTVKIEDITDIDIFEDGLINTIEEIYQKLEIE
ncbi:MAG: phosphopantetheine-binding protein [Bacteroidales bacterium]|jgi:acyl carrier protein|nr:phosphopantetheine-binding protein [Bacteroidales bacterium]